MSVAFSSESVISLSLKYGMITLFAIPEYDAYVVSAIVGFAMTVIAHKFIGSFSFVLVL